MKGIGKLFPKKNTNIILKIYWYAVLFIMFAVILLMLKDICKGIFVLLYVKYYCLYWNPESCYLSQD